MLPLPQSIQKEIAQLDHVVEAKKKQLLAIIQETVTLAISRLEAAIERQKELMEKRETVTTELKKLLAHEKQELNERLATAKAATAALPTLPLSTHAISQSQMQNYLNEISRLIARIERESKLTRKNVFALIAYPLPKGL